MRLPCEVRAGQYWRLENLKSFDEFLARRFPESRRKAYYLMSIHEHLPPQARRELKEVGWTKGLELAKLARRDGQQFDCATWLHKAREMPKEDFRREVEKELTGRGALRPQKDTTVSGRCGTPPSDFRNTASSSVVSSAEDTIVGLQSEVRDVHNRNPGSRWRSR